MAQSTPLPVARQLEHLRTSFAQRTGLPFADLIPDDTPELLGTSDDPIYTRLVTLWMFLSQVLDPVGSCKAAVSRLIAYRAATNQSTCSAHDGAYCKARQRLPEEAIRTLTRTSGTTLSHKSLADWLWKGRRVQIVDGSTVSAADTPDNQKEYPQPDSQKPGLGFPMIRFVVLFCLATGAVLEAALAPYSGKGTGELSLLRQVWNRLETSDILLGDTAYCSYFEIAMLTRRGVDVVLHKHQSRTTDFRTGRRLGHGDHVIEWQKPSRPEWMDKASYDELPATLTVREVRIKVSCPGFRVKSYEVITTLLDTCKFSATELGELYRRRWAAELNLRALKSSMGMDQLRCKSPSMVRKELWIYLLAYNLVRGVLAESAAHVGKSPRQLSFAGAMQSMMTFAPLLSLGVASIFERLWKAVGTHIVGNRPGRVEPRAAKRRPKAHALLVEPRKRAKLRLLRSA